MRNEKEKFADGFWSGNEAGMRTYKDNFEDSMVSGDAKSFEDTLRDMLEFAIEVDILGISDDEGDFMCELYYMGRTLGLWINKMYIDNLVLMIKYSLQ